MPSTKYKISEQIRRMLAGDSPSQGASTKMSEVIEMVGQCCNKLLKTEFYGPHIQGGEKTTDGLSIATYENWPFIKHGHVSQCTLPAMPIKLLKDQGLAHISDMNCPDDPFIPIPNGQKSFIRQEPYTSDLMGQVAYERAGMTVTFNKDLTPEGITSLLLKLVIVDISILTDHDPLPIPSDMEIDIITTVYQILSKKAKPDKVDDPVSDSKQ